MPTDRNHYDVAVIGAGAGGVSAALRAARSKGRVVVFEFDQPGGLCMNRGCVPLTHFMTASQLLADMDLAKEMGIEASGVGADLKVLLKRHGDLLAYMRQGVEGMLKRAGVDIVRGRASFEENGVLAANGQRYQAKSVIIATGGRWKTPAPPDVFKDQPHRIDSLLLAKEPPKRVLFLGSTRWSIEAAQFLRRLGSDVIVATPEKTLLSQESKTMVSRLSKVLKKEGIKILPRAEVSLLEKGRKLWHCVFSTEDGKSEIEADEVFLLDRVASLEGLGLETIGLDSAASFLEVNASLETKAKGVYGIGDVAGPPERHFSHAAAAQGIVAADNAMGKNRTYDDRWTPRVLFTRPQIASVGRTPREAKEAGYEVVTGLAALSMNPLGMILSQQEGAVELVADRRYGEILGVHIIGYAATEMIGACILASRLEATVEELAETSFPHPTLSESISEAARDCLNQM